MKTVELTDESYEALRHLATAKGLTPAEMLAALIREDGPPGNGDELFLFLLSAEFHALSDPEERYLALLAWCADHHRSDFADFVSRQESSHRYLMLDPEEIQGVRAENHARQIDQTQFWAVMAIDDSSKGQFVRRLLEFVGCRDETVRAAGSALGLGPTDRESRQGDRQAPMVQRIFKNASLLWKGPGTFPFRLAALSDTGKQRARVSGVEHRFLLAPSPMTHGPRSHYTSEAPFRAL